MNRTLLIVLALLAGACTNSTESLLDFCNRICEEEKAMTCNGHTDATDCASQCAGDIAVFNEFTQLATTAGCTTQLDIVEACARTTPACTVGCTAEESALSDCLLTFCAENPTSPGCM